MRDQVPAGSLPVVLMTHGWGGSRTTDNSGDVALLTGAGYAVLTWDSRGFGTSGGEANVDSMDFEVRDVQALITFVAGHPAIQTDERLQLASQRALPGGAVEILYGRL